MTMGEARAKVHAAVDLHLKQGGCPQLGNMANPCVACTAALYLLFGGSVFELTVHYTDDFEKYAHTVCGEMVGNTWAGYDEEETEDCENDWSKVNCEKCLAGREAYESAH